MGKRIIRCMMTAGLDSSMAHPVSGKELERSIVTVTTTEGSVRACFCPRCALTVARPEGLPHHLVVCSGTS
jgi:hypothetical protein